MGFWVFMTVCVLLIPLMMIGTGFAYVKGKYPKKINSIYGYRTKLSRKNQNTWEFAQKLFGKVFFIAGLVILLLSIVPMLFVTGKDISICANVGGITTAAQILIMLLTVPIVENRIKKNLE